MNIIFIPRDYIFASSTGNLSLRNSSIDIYHVWIMYGGRILSYYSYAQGHNESVQSWWLGINLWG